MGETYKNASVTIHQTHPLSGTAVEVDVNAVKPIDLHAAFNGFWGIIGRVKSEISITRLLIKLEPTATFPKRLDRTLTTVKVNGKIYRNCILQSGQLGTVELKDGTPALVGTLKYTSFGTS